MRTQIIFLFYFLFLSINIFPQDSVQTINGYTYGKYGVEWYTLNENGKADLVDIKHLIVRLINNADIDKFDNKQYNLPALIITRDKFVASYYVLEIPTNFNPFDYAKLLEATNEFETILFDVYAKINSVPNDPLFTYQWNLSKVDITNAWEINKGNSEVVVAVIDVGGDYNHEDLIGNKLMLAQNFPNPFNSSSTIQYSVPTDEYIVIELFTTLGEKVKTLVNKFHAKGVYTINLSSDDIPSGIYLYRIQTDTKSVTKKLIIIK